MSSKNTESSRPSFSRPVDAIEAARVEQEQLVVALSEMGLVVEGVLGEGGMGTVFLVSISENAMEKQEEHITPNMRDAILQTVPSLFDENSVAPRARRSMHQVGIKNALRLLGTKSHPSEKPPRFALKVVSNKSEGAYNRSFHEARKLYEMQGINDIPRALASMNIDVGGRSYHCICMEELPGITLQEFLKHDHHIRLKLDIAALVSRYCYKFSQHPNATNRDIKPANLMIGPDGSIRGFDLGLMIESFNSDRTQHTQESTTVGTPLYMAPEQRSTSDVTQKADVYSLGVMCTEMFMGMHPYFVDNSFAQAKAAKKEMIYVMQNLDSIIESMQMDLVIPAMDEADPRMRKFIIEDLAPFLKQMMHPNPSHRPDLDQVADRFYTWSSFIRFPKDIYLTSARGQARLNIINKKEEAATGDDSHNVDNPTIIGDDAEIAATNIGLSVDSSVYMDDVPDVSTMRELFESGAQQAAENRDFLTEILGYDADACEEEESFMYEEGDSDSGATRIASVLEFQDTPNDYQKIDSSRYSKNTAITIAAVGTLIVGGIAVLMNNDSSEPEHQPDSIKVPAQRIIEDREGIPASILPINEHDEIWFAEGQFAGISLSDPMRFPGKDIVISTKNTIGLNGTHEALLYEELLGDTLIRMLREFDVQTSAAIDKDQFYELSQHMIDGNHLVLCVPDLLYVLIDIESGTVLAKTKEEFEKFAVDNDLAKVISAIRYDSASTYTEERAFSATQKDPFGRVPLDEYLTTGTLGLMKDRLDHLQSISTKR